MNRIDSITRNNIVSQTSCATKITSQTNFDIESKTDLEIVSQIENIEKEAFLLTAKHNAAKMFSQLL